jgi:hypothetical protein
MTYRNGKVHAIEPAVPGCPRISHLEIQQACNRFLQSRGAMTDHNFRNSEFIFGRGKRRARK